MNQYFRRIATGMLVWLGGAMWHGISVHAAEIKVLSSPGARGIVTTLGHRFEAQTGHKLITDFNVFAVLNRRIEAGEAFDVAILTAAIIDALIQRGTIAADSRKALGRAGIGIAVRKGAPKPDIRSVEAFRKAMLNAKSVAYALEGAGGKIFLAALNRLGIDADMKPKLKGYKGAGVVKAVVSGETELAVSGLGTILAEPGAVLVGGLPGELQSYVVFTIGVSATGKQPEASRALVRFLTAPNAVSVIKENGLEPSD